MSVMVTAAFSVEANVGLNVTLIVQLVPAATEPPQLSISPKSPAFVPVTAMAAVNVALPVLLRLKFRAPLVVPTDWLPKTKLPVERPTTGAVPTPVPVRDTICGLVGALSVMVNEAVRLPVAVGVNLTLLVQLLLAATELPHVLVSPKSPGLAPVIAMPLTDRAAFPVLFRVTESGVLVVPRVWLGKGKVEGLGMAAGPVPVPVRVTVCGLPGALSVMVTAAVSVEAKVGLNVTLIVQLVPAATDPLQLLPSLKSPAFVPVTAMAAVNVALPLFVRVTV